MAENTDKGQAVDWTDEVSDEGGFVLVPEGTYPFMVSKFEKERFEGSEKIAPCPRAAVTLSVMLPDGSLADVTDRILLSTKTLFRVSRFFEGLGFVKNPETGKMPPHWNEIVGKQGWVKIGVRKYPKKDGGEGESNEVKEYLKPADWPQAPGTQPAQQAAPAFQQAQMPVPAQPAQTVHPSAAPQWGM